MKTFFLLATIALALPHSACAAAPSVAGDTATVAQAKDTWTLSNAAMELRLAFKDGSLQVTGLANKAAGRDYLAGRGAQPLFSHTVAGVVCAANDGKWTLEKAQVSPIVLYGKTWGKRLEITLSRTAPVAFSVRQVFELYNDDAGLRLLSFVKNGTDKEVTIGASEVLQLNLPEAPSALHGVKGISQWTTVPKIERNGRNAIVCYGGDGAKKDGLFVIPENNWATSVAPGQNQGVASEKMLYVDAFADPKAPLRVWTNPKAVQLTLFPKEEVEYFAVNLGVFSGDVQDGRFAAEEHLRRRFKFMGPMHQLGTNDWQWGVWNGVSTGNRTEAFYKKNVILPAAAAGFDRVNIDDYWYAPQDTANPVPAFGMQAVCDDIVKHGMLPGHWFSLQARYAHLGWAMGQDAADPANIDRQLGQMRETLIGKYHTRWDQLDGGLLWKTDKPTAYSHPMDSVYRKILGMKRYENAIGAEHADFLMQVTCEIDNPSGAGGNEARGNQNVGLIHLGDNGILGVFRRTELCDDVRDLFNFHGLFPLEGMLSTCGADRPDAFSWQDSPLWYYQFLLARHTMIYSRPWEWNKESVAHLRLFNNWRKDPRICAVLDQPMRPVYNGEDWEKNEGPWCWSFFDKAKGRMLVFAINHLDLAKSNAFAAKLRSLDFAKTYRVEDITMLPGGKFRAATVGTFSGAALKEKGLPVDLDLNPEPCAAYWIEEANGAKADDSLLVQAQAAASSTVAVTAAPVARDAASGGAWNGKYGAKAAWFPDAKIDPGNGFSLRVKDAGAHVWGIAEGQKQVLDVPTGLIGPDGRQAKKKAACWTANDSFTLAVKAQTKEPYALTVYLMDYDIRQADWAREMELTVKTKDGRVLDAQKATAEETAKGVYLRWKVTGSVTVEAKKTRGYNAVVSGVFVDEAK